MLVSETNCMSILLSIFLIIWYAVRVGIFLVLQRLYFYSIQIWHYYIIDVGIKICVERTLQVFHFVKILSRRAICL